MNGCRCAWQTCTRAWARPCHPATGHAAPTHCPTRILQYSNLQLDFNNNYPSLQEPSLSPGKKAAPGLDSLYVPFKHSGLETEQHSTRKMLTLLQADSDQSQSRPVSAQATRPLLTARNTQTCFQSRAAQLPGLSSVWGTPPRQICADACMEERKLPLPPPYHQSLTIALGHD